jgi:protein-S-isoprenylcysteine O-methyltransferase Ste14
MTVLITLLAIFYASHSLLAANAVKHAIQQNFSRFYRFYRLVYSILSTFLLAFVMWWFVAKHQFDFLFLPSPVTKAISFAAFFLGSLLVIISVIKYGVIDFIGFDSLLKKNEKKLEPTKLNTTGLNAIVRHPIYTGVLLLLIGLLLWLPTKMTIITVLITLAYLEIGIYLEEQKLVEEFGNGYKIYRQKVKKIIPFIY